MAATLANCRCLGQLQMANGKRRATNSKQQTANCKLECNFRNTRRMNLITKLKQSQAGSRRGAGEEQKQLQSRRQTSCTRVCACVCVMFMCCCHSCCNVNQLHYHKLLLAYVSVPPQRERERGKGTAGAAEKCTRLWLSGKQDQMMQLWAASCAASQSQSARPAANIIKKPLAQIDNGSGQRAGGKGARGKRHQRAADNLET